ncbi:branched-chain amino acid ABC transporter permease [Alicyclobacillus dauci]|uniref:Branched-chain amino acid ABC transporter permease n=1 Tax=Alicyclobacillus dauci TaxID=1475485 RepID=A0ABY6Z0D1_9BACL|nr:branched-chain amino acid ABC transporter permease [Alicyclobacillus dauci]WAH36172.1 branched-chain amino acid ABC transporter permease [Alicyclobacillus dauci]
MSSSSLKNYNSGISDCTLQREVGKMSVFATLLMNGIANAALYFLMAAGLTLIFGLMRVINFAHGGLYLWGGYIAMFLYTSTHNFVVALIGGFVVGGLLGFLMERGLLASVYRDGNGQLLMTMGILVVLSELIKVPFGRNPQSSTVPHGLNHSWIAGHVVIVGYNVFIIIVGILVYLALQVTLHRSRLGVIIRAGVGNPELVEARGIPIRRIFTLVFILGAALAGFAGALAGPFFGSVTPTMGMDMQLNAFIIVVLGGLGSLNGSLIGSLMIGIATAVVSYFLPTAAILVNVLLMAVVLVIRPEGLFGEKEGAM